MSWKGAYKHDIGRSRRKKRVRKKIRGVTDRPRLSVFRSNRNIYCQLIDDDRGVSIASASSLEKEFPGKAGMDKKEMAKIVGQMIGERAKAKKIDKVVFDRSGYKYHGRVSALADGAREKGLSF